LKKAKSGGTKRLELIKVHLQSFKGTWIKLKEIIISLFIVFFPLNKRNKNAQVALSYL
jgi:hypothetical protein